MKLLLTAAVLILISQGINAQIPPGNPRGGGGFPPGELPKIGVITGVVTDKESGKPLAKASVALQKIGRDSTQTVTGLIATSVGSFRFETIQVGRYRLRITYTGYERWLSDTFFVSPRKPEIDFGTIGLTPGTTTVDEVEVVAEKEMFENSIDKKVFNVDQSLFSRGGTATDVLKNIPSVNVDIDGNVSLRGSDNVTVMIDGKPTGLSGSNLTALLAQLPANSLDKVELITNPSAKYDAEGMAGKINIILKKDTRQNLNGSVSAGAGTIDKYNASVNANYRNSDINVFGSYGFQSERRLSSGTSERENFLSSGTFWLNQYSGGTSKRQNHTGRAGIDFYLGSHTIGISGMFNSSKGGEPETIEYNTLDSLKHLTQLSFRQNSQDNTRGHISADLNYKWVIAPKNELTASAGYSRFSFDMNGGYTQQNYDTVTRLPVLSENPSLQSSYSTNSVSNLTFQTDYSQPVSDDSKLESGLKAGIRDLNNSSRAEQYNYTESQWQTDGRMTNDFRYKEMVFAGYVAWSGTIFESLQYQVGLRAEETVVDALLVTGNVAYNSNYLSIFPSVFFRKNLGENLDGRLSYSRRINRPDIRQVVPFTDYSDTLNLRVGNPALRPEYVNSFEMSLDKYWDKQSVGLTGYFRQTVDNIARIKTVDSVGVSVTRNENLNSISSYGLELLARNQLFPWWDLMTSASVYHASVNAANLSSSYDNSNFSWSGRIMSNMKLWENSTFQITTGYQSPMAGAQGTFQWGSGLDLALKQELLENRNLSLNLSVSDLLNTRRMTIHSSDVNYVQDMERRRDSRSVTLNATYRFGKNDSQKSRREKSGGDSMPDPGGMDDY